MKNPFEEARNQGYSNEEIFQHIQNHPKYADKIQMARQEGYSDDEISNFLSGQKSQKSQRSFGEKAGRIAGQFAIGGLESALLPYEISTIPQASKGAQTSAYRETLSEDIERLQEQKASGVWDEQDQKLYDSLVEQIQNPEKSEQFVKTADIGVRGLAEKATGLDLHPEGVLEKAAGWTAFLKKPKNLIEIAKLGLKPKELIKALIPGTDVARGLAAGTALEMAEEGEFGPLGTLGSAIVGDLIGHAPKATTYIFKNPKKVAAEVTNILTRNNSKKKWAQQFIEDARKSNIQLDVGTLTQSNLVKFAQARAVQSGLTGDALDNFRKELSGQIMREYENIGDELGNLRFENSFQAAEAIKNALNIEESTLKIPKNQARASRSLQGRITLEERPDYEQEFLNAISQTETHNTYHSGETLKTASEDIKRPIQETFNERWNNFNHQVEIIPSGPQAQLFREMNQFVESHSGSLLLGESSPELRVVQAAERLATQLGNEGGLIGVTLGDLIKTKRTLADVANWEFGGSNFESAYKSLVGDIDRAVERVLRSADPELLGQYQMLNAEYSMFKDMFENKNVLPLFEPKNENYNALYNSFINSPDKLRSLEDILYLNTRGQEIINQIKRDYAQSVISRPNVTARELRDLEQVLGPQFTEEIANFNTERQFALEHPLPRAAEQERLPISPQPPSPRQTAAPLAKGKVKEADITVRKKMYDFLKNKSTDQILKTMDTIEGVRKLKRALSLTPEGKALFKDLTRYKLDEMVGQQMKNDMTQQIKLGTFAGLLKSSENKALLKELIGSESYERLRLLQKNAKRIAESAEKFFNASKSGTVAADIAAVSAGVVGLLTGNPYIVMSSVASVGGLRVLSNLFADAQYLRFLEEAILSNTKEKFMRVLEKMRPNIQKAILEAQRVQKEQQD